jgi:hypothetical protein
MDKLLVRFEQFAISALQFQLTLVQLLDEILSVIAFERVQRRHQLISCHSLVQHIKTKTPGEPSTPGEGFAIRTVEIAIQLMIKITLPLASPDDIFVACEPLAGLHFRHRYAMARTFSLLFQTVRLCLVGLSPVITFVGLTFGRILVHFLAPTYCWSTYEAKGLLSAERQERANRHQRSSTNP